MPYSNDPVFTQSVGSAQQTLTAAKATLSGVTSAVKVIAGTTEGCRVTRLWAIPLATVSTALRVDWYISPDGVAATLVGSTTIGTQTVSATAAIAESQETKWSPEEPLELGPNQELWAALSTTFASGINVCAQYQTMTAADVA